MNDEQIKVRITQHDERTPMTATIVPGSNLWPLLVQEDVDFITLSRKGGKWTTWQKVADDE